MRLVRLQLESFRSYAAAELVPDPGLTLIAGPNGAGKTNLLESIWVAVSGRSHRASADAELVARGAPFARVALEVQQPLAFDAYEAIRASGALVLIDASRHQTVAAGMIRGAVAA